MPAQVFDLWISHGIENGYDWKFSADSDTATGTEWQGLFGTHSLSFWANAQWSLTSFIPKKHLLHEATQARVHSIIGACAYGLQTPTANVHNTKQRFRACADFIRENGKVPFPVVGAGTGVGIEIVDGNHRLAALVHLGLADGFDLPIWLAH